MNAHDPALTIEIRLDDSRDLLDAFDRGKIDAAIIRREVGGVLSLLLPGERQAAA